MRSTEDDADAAALARLTSAFGAALPEGLKVGDQDWEICAAVGSLLETYIDYCGRTDLLHWERRSVLELIFQAAEYRLKDHRLDEESRSRVTRVIRNWGGVHPDVITYWKQRGILDALIAGGGS